MRALERKLVRDAASLRGQVITVALVVACGIAAFIAMRGTSRALYTSLDAWYREARFADLFVHLERAPLPVALRLAELPGVAVAQARVVEGASLQVEGFPEPIRGQFLSLPASGVPRLNRLRLRQGRLPSPERTDEILVNEAFAVAQSLGPGDTIGATLEGKQHQLRIVGVVLSPEFIYAMSPGALIQDDARFGVVWMGEDALGTAAGMEGAFNDVILQFSGDVRAEDVKASVDALLEPYGGLGATLREDQLSHRFVTQELQQLDGLSTVMPLLFLAVAAYLVNVVLGRLVGLQREQIAALKAMGYSNREVGLHFLWLVLGVVGLGTAVGILAGVWMGQGLCALYIDVFHFPSIRFGVGPGAALGAIAATFGTALAGAWGSVRQAAKLPPAEAMRPAPPPSYAPGWLERTGAYRKVPPALRMVLRDLERRPWRLLFSALGISLAVATLIVGRFSNDSLEVLMDLQFDRVQREDLAVSFFDPADARALRELQRLPGVRRVEGLRDVPVRLVHGTVEREVALTGLPAGGVLRRVLDADEVPIPIEGPGLHLSRILAEILGVGPGDVLEVHVREGDRRVRELRVARVIDEQFGLGAYLSQDALFALLGEEPRYSTVLLTIDPQQAPAILRAMQAVPRVASVGRASLARTYFEEQSAKVLVIFTAFLVGFACAITIGVVYNNARIALAVRARDLATLRVLGFTRREIATVLLVEAGSGMVLALPLGMVLGRILAWATISSSVDSELFRFPVYIAPSTYAFAVWVTTAAGIASGWLVRSRVNALDLVGVLKERS